jgi:hypothetical protein
MIETFVKTESLYAALFDLASPVNRLGMIQADKSAKECSQPWAVLLHFNAALDSLARQGEVMAWTVLFDGVFKVAVEVLTPTNDISLDEQEASNSSDDSRLLWCPSGKLTVACLGALGRSDLAPIVVIEPGVYRARLQRNLDQEDRHYFLEELSHYPPTEGPDWHIWLQMRNVNRPQG